MDIRPSERGRLLRRGAATVGQSAIKAEAHESRKIDSYIRIARRQRLTETKCVSCYDTCP